jgi:hypothetical protein
MSTATVHSSSRPGERRHGGVRTALTVVPLSVVAAAALLFGVLHHDSRPATRSRAEVLASLDPAARAYVIGVVNLHPARLAAGFGNVAYTGPADGGPALHAGRV